MNCAGSCSFVAIRLAIGSVYRHGTSLTGGRGQGILRFESEGFGGRWIARTMVVGKLDCAGTARWIDGSERVLVSHDERREDAPSGRGLGTIVAQSNRGLGTIVAKRNRGLAQWCLHGLSLCTPAGQRVKKEREAGIGCRGNREMIGPNACFTRRNHEIWRWRQV